MQAEGGNELVSDDEYMDSVADQADLEERSRSSDRASPQTPLDAESGRGRAVSDGSGPTPDAGAGGARDGSHAPEQPGQTDARERVVTPTDARLRHSGAQRGALRLPGFGRGASIGRGWTNESSFDFGNYECFSSTVDMFLKKPSHFPAESGVMTMDNVSATAVRRSSMQPFNIDSSVPPHGSAEASVRPEKEKGAVFEQSVARKAVVASSAVNAELLGPGHFSANARRQPSGLHSPTEKRFSERGSRPVVAAATSDQLSESGSNEEQRRAVKPRMFDGLTSVDEYLMHFEEVSEYNEWSTQQMRRQLILSLSNGVREVLSSTKDLGLYDYRELVDRLKYWFGDSEYAFSGCCFVLKTESG
jgi:hypothetical protein